MIVKMGLIAVVFISSVIRTEENDFHCVRHLLTNFNRHRYVSEHRGSEISLRIVNRTRTRGNPNKVRLQAQNGWETLRPTKAIRSGKNPCLVSRFSDLI